MKFLRNYWPDLGASLALVLSVWLYRSPQLTELETIVWFNLVALFLHQFEEYRFPGTFPGMVNRVMYASNQPDRYPLNTQTAVYVNVFFGWSIYLLAALLAREAIWLAIATMMVSLGNVFAHTFLFNWKGRTVYNAGLLSCWLLFVPGLVFFFLTIQGEEPASTSDYWIGIPLGIAFNYLGILKLIEWNADRHSPFVFDRRNLRKADRNRVD